MRNGFRRMATQELTVSCGIVARHQRTGQAGGRHRRSGRQPHPIAPPGPQLRRPLPLARRHPPQPAGQSRAAIVQVLGLRHRRRRLQLRDEDGGRRVPRGPANAGRSGGHRRRSSRDSQAAGRTPGERRGGVARQTDAATGDGLGREAISPVPAELARGRAGPTLSRRSGASRPRASRQFHLGFSPLERDWILRQAARRSSAENASRAKILETIGILARPAEGGSLYDRFKGRVLFSIRDAQGRPVGIGGRVLPELGTTSPAKYVNSPETPLFTKSKLLYGLDLARDAIRKSRTALVMEGYTDVIVAHQYGFDNAVAVLGTALGESHIRILKRLRRPDRAGARRRRGRAEAGQRSAGTVRRPAGRSADSHAARRPRSVRLPAQVRGRGVCRTAGQRRRSTPWTMPFDASLAGSTWSATFTAPARRWSGWCRSWPRPRGLRPTRPREDRFREEKIVQRLAAQVPRRRARSAASG